MNPAKRTDPARRLDEPPTGAEAPGMWELANALGATACLACASGAVDGGNHPFGPLCARCAGELVLRPRRLPRAPPGARGVLVFGDYQGPLGALIRRAKYRDQPELLDRLSEAGSRWLVAGGVDAVVPAPSLWGRSWRRGWSPAEVVAGPVARRLGRPVHKVLRRAGGVAQASLSRSARREASLRMGVRGPVRGRILLVDDVVTTGATAAAAAAELVAAGADEVWVLALAGGGIPVL